MKFLFNLFLFCLLPALLIAQQLPQTLKLALKNALTDPEKFVAYYQADTYFEQINADSANFYIDKAIKLAITQNKKLCLANALACKGFNLTVKGNYGGAYTLFQNALTLLNDKVKESKDWQPSFYHDNAERIEMAT